MSNVESWRLNRLILVGTAVFTILTILLLYIIVASDKPYGRIYSFSKEDNIWAIKFLIALGSGHCVVLGGGILAAMARFHPPLIMMSLFSAIWPVALFVILALNKSIPWWMQWFWSAILISAGPVLIGAVASTVLAKQRQSNGWYVPLGIGIATLFVFIYILSHLAPPA